METKKQVSDMKPYVRIVEQPRSRGLRFRYEREARHSGSIVGETSCRAKKTSPTIEIVNGKGPYYIVVSCVSMDPPHQPHPHKLEGRGKEFAHGLYYRNVTDGTNIIEFPGLNVQCAKKNDAMAAIEERQKLKVDPFDAGYPEAAADINLNCIRLCFQVFAQDEEGKFTVALTPIVSQPIYDKKASAEFIIMWMSHASASVAGGKTICILCDKVVRDDIQVIFYCEESGWEKAGDFTCPYFHKQVAVIMKTPKYVNQGVTEPVDVQVMLRRISKKTNSVPVSFQLIPHEASSRDLRRAKRRRLSVTPRELVDQQTDNFQATSKFAGDAGGWPAVHLEPAAPPSWQTGQAEASSLPSEFLHPNYVQFPQPPPPQTPFEFREILERYMNSDPKRNFSS